MAGDSVARLRVDHGWPATFQALAAVALMTSGAGVCISCIQRRGAA